MNYFSFNNAVNKFSCRRPGMWYLTVGRLPRDIAKEHIALNINLLKRFLYAPQGLTFKNSTLFFALR